MTFQRMKTMEDLIAEEKRSTFRVIRPQRDFYKQKNEQSIVALTEKEIAYNWLMNELATRYAAHMSEKSIFGTVSFNVPVAECDPNLIEEIMAMNHIPLVNKKCWYNLTTNELISVNLTYDTPALGIIHMPI